MKQSGTQVDARFGLTKDYESGATLEMVAVSYRYGMTHDVRYPQTWRWPPCAPCPEIGAPCQCNPTSVPPREEHNLDRTNIAGLHAVYLAPKTAAGWRMGYLLTANRLSHPKIPNYQIKHPAGPGHTGFNFGVGMMRPLGHSTFGLDVILEPMWSNTWADAAGTPRTASSARAHTVDNHFRFSTRASTSGSRDFAYRLVHVVRLPVRCRCGRSAPLDSRTWRSFADAG